MFIFCCDILKKIEGPLVFACANLKGFTQKFPKMEKLGLRVGNREPMATGAIRPRSALKYLRPAALRYPGRQSHTNGRRPYGTRVGSAAPIAAGPMGPGSAVAHLWWPALWDLGRQLRT